jgi:predicted RNA-binding protein with PUA-like domain
MPRYWLMKSEPESYSIQHLERDGRTSWEGVRNYQARNFMRDEMEVGDPVLFYHSNTEPIGVAGLARVARTAYPDSTALDPASHYYDPKATRDDPRWYLVDIEFVERFPAVLSLAALRDVPALADMPLLNRSRLSVQPVTRAQFDTIVALGRSRT